MNSVLPICDWIYYATPACASACQTAEIVVQAKQIIRTLFNSKGQRIANVQHVEPGDKILLAFGGEGKAYKPLLCGTVTTAASPIRHDRCTFRHVRVR